MKVTAFIRQTSAKNNTSDLTHIYFRVRDGKTDIKAASELTINPNHWSAERQGYKNRVSLVAESKKTALDNAVHELTSLISQKYYRGADGEWLKTVIEEYHHPEINKYGGKDKKNLLIARVSEYAELHPMTENARNRHRENVKKLTRFEKYMREVKKHKGYTMNIDTMTTDDLRMYENYLINEHEIYKEHPEIFDEGIRKPHPQSENSRNTLFRRLRTVINWCLKNEYTKNNPFATYETPKELYGPPIYLTLEERDKVYNADLSQCCKGMQIYRDIFMFQCLIGCRVGDLMLLTKANIVDGAVEYIAEKTKTHNPRVIRIPLNDKAKAILTKYSDLETRLLPKLNENDYIKNIRKILSYCGINRNVPFLNPLTRETEMRPICEVATTHTARKTFIANLYKKVKDPALVASLSGHSDGSRAFARYREIDMDMKRELVDLID